VGCQSRAGQVDGPLWIRRPRAIGRKNYLFAGSDAGGRRAAAIYSLIESAKLNGLNPQHYLADVLARITDHLARRIAELLPWN
jgi:transposase